MPFSGPVLCPQPDGPTLSSMTKAGRPSSYTDELAAEICDRLSQGEPLAVMCRDAHMPDPSTVWLWRQNDPEFFKAIARAREIGHDAIADECVSIADNVQEDPASRRVRTDVRLKLLAKWDPRRYGDRLAHVGGDPSTDPPLQVNHTAIDPGEAYRKLIKGE